jgi:hypothetical protein
MPPATASAPNSPPPWPVPAGHELLEGYRAVLAARGGGNPSFLGAARVFLARWPDPQRWAAQPLPVRLSAGPSTRPLLNYLMLAGSLRPGYDYLLERKLPALLREARLSPLAADLTRFLAAATELGYTPKVAAGLASQVAVRMLIQTGRPLHELHDADIAEFEAAITAREQAHDHTLKHYRTALRATRAVLYHLDGHLTPRRKTPRTCAGPGGVTSTVSRPGWPTRWSPTWNAPQPPAPARPCSASPPGWGTSPGSSPSTTRH